MWYKPYKSGPVVIIGGLPDSNCAQCQTNAQGHLLRDLIDRTGQLCDLATGPTHTFYGGGGRNTTVDFCFLDCWAAYLVLECAVLPRHPLTLSDHLAVKVKLDCQPEKILQPENVNRKLNWKKAHSNGCIESFQKIVNSLSVHVTEIDGEIASVVSIIHQAAAATIPSSGQKSGLYFWRMRTRFSAFLAHFERTHRCGKGCVAVAEGRVAVAEPSSKLVGPFVHGKYTDYRASGALSTQICYTCSMHKHVNI